MFLFSCSFKTKTKINAKTVSLFPRETTTQSLHNASQSTAAADDLCRFRSSIHSPSPAHFEEDAPEDAVSFVPSQKPTPARSSVPISSAAPLGKKIICLSCIALQWWGDEGDLLKRFDPEVPPQFHGE
jgi:hypothetical protein